MAAGILSAPGTEYGPCATDCAHIDCKQTHEMAAATCHVCGKAIGYGKRFYRQGLTLSHAPCLEDSIYAIGRKTPSLK